LIRNYSPSQSFTRSGAITTIRQEDPASGKQGFSKYEGLFIEPGEQGKLTPQIVFNYLLTRGVFRAGLRLKIIAA